MDVLDHVRAATDALTQGIVPGLGQALGLPLTEAACRHFHIFIVQGHNLCVWNHPAARKIAQQPIPLLMDAPWLAVHWWKAIPWCASIMQPGLP